MKCNRTRKGYGLVVEGKKKSTDSDISGAVQDFLVIIFDCCGSRIGDTWNAESAIVIYDRNYD